MTLYISTVNFHPRISNWLVSLYVYMEILSVNNDSCEAQKFSFIVCCTLLVSSMMCSDFLLSSSSRSSSCLCTLSRASLARWSSASSSSSRSMPLLDEELGRDSLLLTTSCTSLDNSFTISVRSPILILLGDMFSLGSDSMSELIESPLLCRNLSHAVLSCWYADQTSFRSWNFVFIIRPLNIDKTSWNQFILSSRHSSVLSSDNSLLFLHLEALSQN